MKSFPLLSGFIRVHLRFHLFLCALCVSAVNSSAQPQLDRPTLHCLGVHWIVPTGDPAATVSLDYRKANDAAWMPGQPLFRVEKGRHLAEKYGSKLDVPDTSTLFAGSVVDLTPDTAYEIRLTLHAKSAPDTTHTLTGQTRAEPQPAQDAHTYHVTPATADPNAGTGTEADPFQGLPAAQAAAKPGDVFLLHPGVYEGTFEIKKSGQADKPIVWRGQSAEKVILDGKGKADKRPSRVISASDTHDLIFENLSIINADWGVVFNDSARNTLRGCHIHHCDYGLTATRNDKDHCQDLFIADNVVEGPCTWPRTKGIEDPRGIQVSGAGHVICYNRIKGFSDAIDTFNSQRCEAIDFHNNEISQCTDDGCELDYSTRNVRCFDNRFTDCYQGISVQPVFGGPVYAYRNALYNVVVEPFKMHNAPSGALFYHNTIVKKGSPLILMTSDSPSNLVMRNNLFIGTGGHYAWECSPPMVNCDFDYDGFAKSDYKLFLKWNNQRYPTFEAMRIKSPIEHHAAQVDPATCFATGAAPPIDEKEEHPAADLRLGLTSQAKGVGQSLPGFNAPPALDLGAYQSDRPLPHYGPRSTR